MIPLFLLLLLLLFSSEAQIFPSPQRTLPQCQCVPDSKGTGCLQYDSRLQAATLDEAMASFPDLSLERPENNPDAPLESQATCNTQECMDCQRDLSNKLVKVGLLPTVSNATVQPAATLTSSCTKYKFSQQTEGVYDKDDKGRKDDDSDSDESDEDDEEDDDKHKRKEKWGEYRQERKQRRQRRQAMVSVGSTITVVGQRFTMSCSAKGVAADSAGLVPLCSTCWVWRQLPSNYEPQFVNELICDGSDSGCLSGYASCGIGYRSVDVVRIDGTTRTTVSISAAAYCECKISRSSALLGLVTGNATNPPPPPPPVM